MAYTYYCGDVEAECGEIGVECNTIPGPIYVDFITYRNGVTLPTTIDFTNTSSPYYAVSGYLWDFGDGTSSTDENPSHTYTQAGTYVVTLTIIIDDNNRRVMSRQRIVITSVDRFINKTNRCFSYWIPEEYSTPMAETNE